MIKRWGPILFSSIILTLGVLALIWIFQGNCFYGAVCVLIGAILSTIYNFFEKKLGLLTDFGREFRSLTALISFGLAPSMIIFFGIMVELPIAGLLLSSLYVICSALQLAWFNTTFNRSNYHFGLRIELAGSLLVVLNKWSPKDLLLPSILIIIFSALMIVKIPMRKK